MRYLILLLVLLVGCSAPQNFDEANPQETADDMPKYPHVQEAPSRGVPQVGIVTPRNGGWSGDNQLGYVAKYGPDQRGLQTILKLDEWGPPEVWTIRLYVTQSFKDFDGFNITAIVNYGAGGSTQTIEMDWSNGAEISLPMNALNVMARFENVSVVDEGGGLSLGVQIARGARGGTAAPVKTIVERYDFTNGVHAFDLPLFARRVVLIPEANDAAGRAALYNVNTFLATQAQNATAIGSPIMVCTGDRAFAGGTLELPVTGQARSVFVNNPFADTFSGTLYVELDG